MWDERQYEELLKKYGDMERRFVEAQVIDQQKTIESEGAKLRELEAEVQQLRQGPPSDQVEELEARVSSLTEAIKQQAEKDKQEFQVLEEAFKCKANELEARISDMEKQAVKDCQDIEEKYATKIEGLEVKLRGYEDHIRGLEDQLRASAELCKDQYSQISKIKEQAVEDCKEHVKKIEGLEVKLRGYEDHIRGLEDQLRASAELCKDQYSQISKIKEQAVEDCKEHVKKIEGLEVKLRGYEDHIRGLEDQLRASAELCKDQYSQISKIKEQAVEDCKEHVKKIGELEGKIRVCEDHSQRLKDQEGLMEEVVDLRAQISKMSGLKEQKEAVDFLKAELETAKQACHNDKMRLKRLESLEVDYQDQIRSYQSTEKKLCQEFKAKEDSLQKTLSTLRTTIRNLESEIETKNEKISSLPIPSLPETPREPPPVDEKLLRELEEVKLEHADLLETLSRVEESHEADLKTKEELEGRNRGLLRDVEELRESLDSLRTELAESKVLVQNLRDENFVLRSELESLRNTPLDEKSRGNSIFAELEDRRVGLQNENQAMKKRFLEIQQERGGLLREVERLRSNNVELMRRLRRDEQDRSQDVDKVEAHFQAQVKHLNTLIDSYCNELKEESERATRQDRFDRTVKAKSQEIEKLRQEISILGLNNTSLAMELAQERRSLRLCQLDLGEIKEKFNELKSEVEKMKEVPPEAAEVPVEAAAVKSIMKNGGQGGGRGKVQFGEGTKEECGGGAKPKGRILAKPVPFDVWCKTNKKAE